MNRARYTDHSRPVTQEDYPKVDVIVAISRGDDHEWVKQCLESIRAQVYPNMGLVLVDMEGLSMTDAWNIGVRSSTAELVAIVREEDTISVDLIHSMVDHYIMGRKAAPNLVHVTTLVTCWDPDQRSAVSVQMPHVGLFNRERLAAYGFSGRSFSGGYHGPVLDAMVADMAAGQALTAAIGHHHGYVWRNHMFRPDRINIAT